VLVLLKRKHHDRRAATATGYGYGYGHDRPLLGGRDGFARVTAAAALVRGRQPSIQLVRLLVIYVWWCRGLGQDWRPNLRKNVMVG